MSAPHEEKAADALWPLRLAGAFARLRSETGAGRREARENLWVLLYFGLMRCLRAVAARRGSFEPFDLEDLASKKSLEILRQAECGKTDLSRKTAREVVAFLSAVARHGLLDLRRAQARAPGSGGGQGEGRSMDGNLRPWPSGGGSSDAGEELEAREFTAALRSCAEALPPRSLAVWFFRVFLDMSSREISDHPDIALNPGHVDVLLQRTRASLESCMEKKGQRWRQLPPGTFTVVWEMMRAWAPADGVTDAT